MRCRELDHFARADEQHARFRERFEQLRGQSNGCRRHADGVAADLGRRPDFLGDCERPLEHLLQGGAERAGTVRLAHRLFQLTQDLRLAQHHRVETAGDPEGVTRRGGSLEHIGVGTQGLAGDIADLGEPFDGGIDCRRIRPDIELGPVAGRDDGDFGNPLVARAERLQRDRELLRREGEAAAQVEGRGGVVEAESKDAHGQIIKLEPDGIACKRTPIRAFPRLPRRDAFVRPGSCPVPIDVAFWHIANFFAPAVITGFIASGAAKLIWRRELTTTGWLGLAACSSAAMAAVSVLGLVVFEHDGKMVTYAAMVAVCALVLWWAGFGRR